MAFEKVTEFLRRECESASVFEAAISQNHTSPLAHLLQLLTILSFFGHLSPVLSILRGAFDALEEFIVLRNISSAAELVLHLTGDDMYSLSCEPFYFVLVRTLDAGLSHPSFAAEVASLTSPKRFHYDGDIGVGIETMFARSAERKIYGSEQAFYSPFSYKGSQDAFPIRAGVSTSSPMDEVLKVCKEVFEESGLEDQNSGSASTHLDHKYSSFLFDEWASLTGFDLASTWKEQLTSSSCKIQDECPWFSFCCILLACGSLGSPEGACSKIARNATISIESRVSIALSNLAKYSGEEAPLVILQNAGIPPALLAKQILEHWFVGFLMTRDIFLITAATLIDGDEHVSTSLERLLFMISRDIRKTGCDLTGIESIIVNGNENFAYL